MDGCLELDLYFIFAFYFRNILQKKPEANKTKMVLHNL